MNCHTLKFKVRYGTSWHVRYHSKNNLARSTATAYFEETARTYSRTYYIRFSLKQPVLQNPPPLYHDDLIVLIQCVVCSSYHHCNLENDKVQDVGWKGQLAALL